MFKGDLKYTLLTVSRALVWIICTGSMIGCGSNSVPPPPAYVLSADTFADLLVDFSLAESAASTNILMVKGHQIDSAYAFDPLRERQISPVVYDSTLRYYARHPEQYKEVYQKVLTKLSALESARRGTPSPDSVKATLEGTLRAGFKVRSGS